MTMNQVEDQEDDLHLTSEGHKSTSVKDTQCGIGPCKPRCLQAFPTIGMFTGVYGIAGFVTSSLSAYLTSQVTSLERQFGLSSSQSGFLLGCNDIGYLVSAVVASHFATRLHVPRTLALATLIFGLSAFLSASPHFLFGNHSNVAAATAPVSVSRGENSTSSFSPDIPLCGLKLQDPCGNSTDSGVQSSKHRGALGYSQAAFGIIAVSMMIQGIAKSLRFPFLTSYIDDNVPKTRTGFYMGIISSLGVFGPAMAFGLGSVFSKMYVTLEDRAFSPRDPRWVGAWWLGFLVFGVLAVLSALPIALFPRRLTARPPSTPSSHKPRNRATEKSSRLVAELADFARSLKRLVKTPAFVLVTSSSTFKIFSVAAALSFMPKYIETQFQQPAWKANLTLAGINVVAAALGTFIGGALTSRFKMAEKRCLKLITGLEISTLLIIALGFGLGCPQPRIIGTHLPGYNPVWDGQLTEEMCDVTCHCSSAEFFPVCSKGGNSYFSPCLLGCEVSTSTNISSCSCSGEGWASPGVCQQDCSMLIPYGAIVFAISLLSCMTIMPHFIVTIRAVEDRDKAMAAGVSAFVQSLFGWFLGPMVFGAFIDSTCLLWENKCGSRGACALYDFADFRVKLHGLVLGARVFSLLFAAACLLLYVRRDSAKREKEPPKAEIVVFCDPCDPTVDRVLSCDHP